LTKIQQYRSNVNIINHIQELVEIEVDIKCRGQVFKMLTTESQEGNRNGCNCNNNETSAIKVSRSCAENMAICNEKEISMDENQVVYF
jgi:hypothetical protein